MDVRLTSIFDLPTGVFAELDQGRFVNNLVLVRQQ